jgi:hypothetical protein
MLLQTLCCCLRHLGSSLVLVLDVIRDGVKRLLELSDVICISCVKRMSLQAHDLCRMFLFLYWPERTSGFPPLRLWLLLLQFCFSSMSTLPHVH